MTQIALSLPRLELLRTEVRALGARHLARPLAVANSGWLPAYVTKRALERKTVRGVIFEIHLPEGDALDLARQRQAAHGRPAARRPRAEELAATRSCRTARSPPTAPSASGSCGRRRERGWRSARAPIAPARCAPRSCSTSERRSPAPWHPTCVGKASGAERARILRVAKMAR